MMRRARDQWFRLVVRANGDYTDTGALLGVAAVVLSCVVVNGWMQ